MENPHTFPFLHVNVCTLSRPSIIRNSPAFQHRLCIRISTDLEKKTLSVTDLGCGMSRADLINSLAAGKLSSNTIDIIRNLSNNDTINNTNTSSLLRKTNTHENFMDSDTDCDSMFGDEETTAQPFSSNESSNGIHDTEDHIQNHDPVLSCRAVDIGGFYAALCALGKAIQVDTKVCPIVQCSFLMYM